MQSSQTLCSGSAASRESSVEVRNSHPWRACAHSSALHVRSLGAGRWRKRIGRVVGRRDDAGALLVRARIDERLGGRAPKRLLEFLPRQREQLRNVARLARLEPSSRPTISVRADWRKKKSAPLWPKILGGSGMSAAASASASIASLPGLSSHHGDHAGQRASSGFRIRSPRSGR